MTVNYNDLNQAINHYISYNDRELDPHRKLIRYNHDVSAPIRSILRQIEEKRTSENPNQEELDGLIKRLLSRIHDYVAKKLLYSKSNQKTEIMNRLYDHWINTHQALELTAEEKRILGERTIGFFGPASSLRKYHSLQEAADIYKSISTACSQVTGSLEPVEQKPQPQAVNRGATFEMKELSSQH